MSIQLHSENTSEASPGLGDRREQLSAFMTNWMMRESRSCCGLRKTWRALDIGRLHALAEDSIGY
jgi:hypothetical protein